MRLPLSSHGSSFSLSLLSIRVTLIRAEKKETFAEEPQHTTDKAVTSTDATADLNSSFFP